MRTTEYQVPIFLPIVEANTLGTVRTNSRALGMLPVSFGCLFTISIPVPEFHVKHFVLEASLEASIDPNRDFDQPWAAK